MARRSKGEGNFYTYRNGPRKGTIKYTWSEENQTFYVYGKTRNECLEKRDRRKKEIEREKHPPVPKIADQLKSWLERNYDPDADTYTYKRYEGAIQNHLIPAFGDYPLTDLKRWQVQEWVDDRIRGAKDYKLKKNSLAMFLSPLRQMYAEAIEREIVERNPAQGVKLPEDDASPISILADEAEAQALLLAVRDHALEGPVCLCLFLAMREGEVTALRPKDVDLTNKKIHVEASLKLLNGEWRRARTKSKKSRRIVPIPDFLLPFVHRIVTERLKTATDEDLLFLSPTGRTLNAKSFRDHFARRLRQSGLPPMRIHDLRHSCATLLDAYGVPIETIQEILGHDSAEMTRHYLHITEKLRRRKEEEKREGLSRLSGLFARDL